jgi:hypothetical protein
MCNVNKITAVNEIHCQEQILKMVSTLFLFLENKTHKKIIIDMQI